MADPTPYEAMRLFAEGLIEELQDEHSCTEVAVYRRTLADIASERDAETLRRRAAHAALAWFELTHAERFGHDHHCRAARWEEVDKSNGLYGTYKTSVQVETGNPCTCGWRPFQEALDALINAEVSPTSVGGGSE